MERRYMRAMYSPRIPRERSWTPEKMTMTEKRRVNPRTGMPPRSHCTRINVSNTAPKATVAKPVRLATRKGKVLKLVTMLIACRTSFRKVKPVLPPAWAS